MKLQILFREIHLFFLVTVTKRFTIKQFGGVYGRIDNLPKVKVVMIINWTIKWYEFNKQMN